jgi:hypothetical protein
LSGNILNLFEVPLLAVCWELGTAQTDISVFANVPGSPRVNPREFCAKKIKVLGKQEQGNLSVFFFFFFGLWSQLADKLIIHSM